MDICFSLGTASLCTVKTQICLFFCMPHRGMHATKKKKKAHDYFDARQGPNFILTTCVAQTTMMAQRATC